MTVADRILELAAQNRAAALTPAEVVVRLGISEWTAYKTLARMRERGLLVRAGYGCYHLPGVKLTARPNRKLLWSRLLDLEGRVERLERLERLVSDVVP